MGQVRARPSRLSPAASIIMIVLGILSFLYVNGYAGLILILLGIAMYAAYLRVTRRPRASPLRPDKDK